MGDALLRRFFMARIGLRFLVQHQIESANNRDGHSGILQLECDPKAVAQKAASDSASLCRAHLGQAPPVLVHDAMPGTFTYVPMHLHYMLVEVFKNACRAVTERHADGFDDALPPIHCQIVHGADDLTLRISDEGGGFSRAQTQEVWKFMWSTYKKSAWKTLKEQGRTGVPLPRPSSGDSATNPLQRPLQKSSGPSGVLAGYGVGLSLSRLYAQYFGGDLRIHSLDGFGTDVYLHLSRLGTHCENLPNVVLVSPSMRDSSLSDESSDADERFLLSAAEEAFLRAELLNFRRGNGTS